MNAISIYEPDTGRIVFSARGQIDILGYAQYEGLPYIEEFANSDYKYVQNGQIVDRPPNPAVLSGTTLTNVPPGCVIDYMGVQTTITTPEYTVEVVTQFPQFRLICFPYRVTFYEVQV